MRKLIFVDRWKNHKNNFRTRKNFVPQQQCDWVWVPDSRCYYSSLSYGWKDMEIVEEIILYICCFFSVCLESHFYWGWYNPVGQISETFKSIWWNDLFAWYYFHQYLSKRYFFDYNILKYITSVHKWLFAAVIKKSRENRIFSRLLQPVAKKAETLQRKTDLF